MFLETFPSRLKITDFIKLDDAEQETKKKILLKKPASLDEKHVRVSEVGDIDINFFYFVFYFDCRVHI